MSKYTRSIMSIMQQNAGTQDITTIDGLYAVSSSSIFNVGAINVIDEKYRKQLIVGFTKHYFMDEIGIETLALWKLALDEKLYNYGSYINSIYDNIDKEIFADYRVTKANKTSKSDTLNTNATEVTGSNTDSYSDNVSKDGKTTYTGGGSVTSAKTGSDETANTGTEELAHTGTQGTEDSNSSTVTNTGTTKNADNTIDITYDTPMGSLANMRTPGGDATGRGVEYANAQTYNYMAAAAEHDATSVQTDDTASTTTGSGDSTTTFNDTNTTTRNLSSETTYNTTDTQTRNINDETNVEDEETRTGSKNGSTTSNTTGTANTNVEAEDNAETVDYSLNWEMLYKSMPLLNKLWDVFDDLFMGIY